MRRSKFQIELCLSLIDRLQWLSFFLQNFLTFWSYLGKKYIDTFSDRERLVTVLGRKMMLNISFSHPWVLTLAFIRFAMTLEMLFWAWAIVYFTQSHPENSLIVAKLQGTIVTWYSTIEKLSHPCKAWFLCFCFRSNKQNCWKNDNKNGKKKKIHLYQRKCFYLMYHLI